jgi:exosortase
VVLAPAPPSPPSPACPAVSATPPDRRRPGPDVARSALPLAAVTLAAALAVWPMFVHAAEVWATVEAFGYGFLVPPLSLLLVWWQWPALRARLDRGAWGGVVVVFGALVVALVATRAGINALAGLAVVPLLWGVVVALWGWGAGRVLAFPIGFLAFGLGAYTGALNRLGFALQEVTAAGAGALAQAIGLGVVREGLVLRAAGFAFVVAEQCSGMSSLLSLLALAVLWGFLAAGTPVARLGLILSVLPLVVLANVARVTLVLLVAALFGQDAALGFFHQASSLVLFGVAIGGLLLVARWLGCRVPQRAGWS